MTETIIDTETVSASGGSVSATFHKQSARCGIVLQVSGDSSATNLDVEAIHSQFDVDHHTDVVTGIDASSSDQRVLVHACGGAGDVDVVVTNRADSDAQVSVSV